MVERYRKSGLAALARKGRTDDGGGVFILNAYSKRSRAWPWSGPPLPITAIYRQVKLFADSIGETVPSYPAVHRIVRKLPASLLMLAHEGGKAYSESFDLVDRREASARNAIWQADHAQLDILILREDGSTAKRSHPLRLFSISYGFSAALSRQRSRVRAPSSPPYIPKDLWDVWTYSDSEIWVRYGCNKIPTARFEDVFHPSFHPDFEPTS
jgi:hypothetical protein